MKSRIAILPFAAACVAFTQMLVANLGDLSPWRGGGFGMFASTDSPTNRRLLIRATDEAGSEYEVQFASERLAGDLAARPRGGAVTFPAKSRVGGMRRA